MINSIKDNFIFCVIASCYSICIHSIICVFANILSLFAPKREVPDENEYIRKYLDSYLKKDKPGFAVFLNGAWGSGKTYFINRYNSKNKEKCYVSLFGITNKNEFEYRLWKGMIFDSPYIIFIRMVLTIVIAMIVIGLSWWYMSDAMRIWFMKYPILKEFCLTFFNEIISSRILTSTLGALSIVTAITLLVWKFIRLKAMEILLQERFLVFDDLERVETSCDDVLSWINEFVEHIHCPVILIGNEEAIIDNLRMKYKDQAKEAIDHYNTIKEKTIDKEFKFEQSDERVIQILNKKLHISSALRNFLDKPQKIHWFVSHVLEPLKKAPYKHQTNYRVLAQCFSEFDAYFNKDNVTDIALWNAFVSNENHWEGLILCFFSFMYLKRIHKIPKSRLVPLESSTINNTDPDLEYSDYFASIILKREFNRDDIITNKFHELYPCWSRNFYDSLLFSVNIWWQINQSKNISVDDLTKYIKKIICPTILTRWLNESNLDDDEFEKLLNDTEKEFINPTIQTIEELIDFISILYDAFNQGYTNWTKSQLEDKLHQYIEKAVNNINLENYLADRKKYLYVIELLNNNDKIHGTITMKFILAKIRNSQKKSSELLFKSIINQIKLNPNSFVQWYKDKDINNKDCFTFQDPQELWNVIKELSKPNFSNVIYTLLGHFTSNEESKEREEIMFWRGFIETALTDVLNWKDKKDLRKQWIFDDFRSIIREWTTYLNSRLRDEHVSKKVDKN